MSVVALLALFVPLLAGNAVFAANVEGCATALSPDLPSIDDLSNTYMRVLLGNSQEINIYLGGSDGEGRLQDAFMVVGSTSTRPDSHAVAVNQANVPPRVDFSQIRLSRNRQRLTLSSEDPEIQGIIELNQPLSHGSFDVKSFRLTSGDPEKLPPHLRKWVDQKFPAVILENAAIRIYSGAAAVEIEELLQKSLPESEVKERHYRGLHTFSQDPHVSVYLRTHVETAHLLRGLAALGLRADHPIFEDLK